MHITSQCWKSRVVSDLHFGFGTGIWCDNMWYPKALMPPMWPNLKPSSWHISGSQPYKVAPLPMGDWMFLGQEGINDMFWPWLANHSFCESISVQMPWAHGGSSQERCREDQLYAVWDVWFALLMPCFALIRCFFSSIRGAGNMIRLQRVPRLNIKRYQPRSLNNEFSSASETMRAKP